MAKGRRAYAAAVRSEARSLRRRIVAVCVLGLFALSAACSDGDESDGEASESSGTAVEAEVLLSARDEVVATLDPRFLSYNVEMVEVTGGEFWKPYDAGEGKVTRPPLDLGSERIRNLARALGPAYVRVSGSWANSTYFDPDADAGDAPPEGFGGLLTGEQWIGVGDFADAVDGEVLTSFASNEAVRDPDGRWLDDQARLLLEFSREHEIPLAAVEMFNEPNLVTSMPEGYDPTRYGQDHGTFAAMVDEVWPELQVVGPATTNEVVPTLLPPSMRSGEILPAIAADLDAFSYHSYPKVSERCGSTEGPEIALTDEFLSRIEIDRDYYEELRDEHVPEAPMWVTETAQAACGGDRWAATSLDVVRFVDTLGRLAHGDGDVVFHNTLAASDYGLIDEDGLVPRPDYWAAVLWNRLMGPPVLAVDPPDVPDLSVHAQCTPDADRPSITFAVVNSSATASRTVAVATGDVSVYRLTPDPDDPGAVDLNGTRLEAADDGTLPELQGDDTNGAVTVEPASVAFIVAHDEGTACT